MASLASQRDNTTLANTTTSNIPASFPPHIASLLTRLHADSLTQEHAIDSTRLGSIRSQLRDFASQTAQDRTAAIQRMDDLMVDKFIALDQDKCLFIYATLVSMRATRVVEAGTSFGVSTVYLALAVGRGGGAADGSEGKVIATEKEESKAAKAREIWSECGEVVEGLIDLRVGDLGETLREGLGGEVDALLLDIWPYVALPALKLVQPRMRKGAVVFTDNTISSKDGYTELLSVLRDPSGPWRSITLPFSGGLEMSIYDP